MMLEWNASGALGVATAFAVWAMAWGIYSFGPQRQQNRLLALALAMEGGMLISWSGLRLLFNDPLDAGATRGIEFACQSAAMLLYLAFLGTVDSPLSRPFRSIPVRRTLVAGATSIFLAWPWLSPQFLSWEFVGDLRRAGWLGDLVDRSSFFIALLGLVIALDAWRRTVAGSLARERARAYAIAFGVRDLFWVYAYGGTFYGAVVGWDSPGMALFPSSPAFLAVASLLFVLLLGYGIAKAQLFDIDLKIKWTLKQSTVAAAFLAVFFAVSEGAAAFFSGAIGTYAGIVAAALLVFALAPLQRFAERVSDRAMPAVEATPAYVAFRKMEVYKGAFEEVVSDGSVTEKERRVLERLRAQLGLSADDARALEHDITARATEAASG